MLVLAMYNVDIWFVQVKSSVENLGIFGEVDRRGEVHAPAHLNNT